MKYVPETKEELKALCEDFSIYLGDIDTGRIADMSRLFEDSERKNFAGIEDWDVSNVVDMSYMFSGAKAFNHPIGNWDVSNVVSMNNMFDGATSFKQDLSAWKLSPHVDDYEAFYNSGMGKDLSMFPKHCVEHYIEDNPMDYSPEDMEGKILRVFNIQWDTDGEDVSLPKEVVIGQPSVEMLSDAEGYADAVGDYLSGTFGFCVQGFNVEVLNMDDKQNEALSVKEQLMALGMKEEDFGRHESDLYVRVTPVSQKFLETYPFKNDVERFIDNIEHVPFYDFPFAALKEKIQADKEEMEFFKEKYYPKKQQDSYSSDTPLDGHSDFQSSADEVRDEEDGILLDGLRKALERYGENGRQGICGPWNVHDGGYDLQFEICYNGNSIVGCYGRSMFSSEGSLERHTKISDKMFSEICDLVHSAFPECSMSKEEQEAIRLNKQEQR